MKLQLYPWQTECLNAWSAHDYHGIVNVITGAGKTVLALAAIDILRHKSQKPLRVKIVVPTTSLLSQWSGAMLNYFDSPAVCREDIGYYYGSHKDQPDRGYMIYVINSARYALARHVLSDLKQGYDVLLIADECHHYSRGENKKIFDFLPFLNHTHGHYYSLGLSATPQTFDYESVLVPALGSEIYHYGFADAAQKNTISHFAIFQISLPFDAEERSFYEELSNRLTLALNRLTALYPSLKNTGKNQFFGLLNNLAASSKSAVSSLANSVLNLSYQRKSLICSAKSRLFCTSKLIRSLDLKSRIIIFGERIEQADQIYHLLARQYPNQVGRFHSRMGPQARKNALERYRNGELRILVSCRSLDEGFDVPAASVGIVLSSTSMERQRIQRLGRILRRQHGKDMASLYYLYIENTVEEPSFFPETPDYAFSGDLCYTQSTDSFSYPEYEKLAVRVLHNVRTASPDKAIWKEAAACLLEGMVRPDWLLGDILGDDVWDEKLRMAKTTKEKNYWTCMRQVSRMHNSMLP